MDGYIFFTSKFDQQRHDFMCELGRVRWTVSLHLKSLVCRRNPRVPCRSLPDLDLSHWKEEVTQCRVNGLDIALGSSRKISPCTSCTCTKEGVREDFDLIMPSFLEENCSLGAWLGPFWSSFIRIVFQQSSP